MEKSRIFQLSDLVYVFASIYLFLAFLQLPFGISIGLDPSWEYALSYAAENKLQFGKDIVFTYGPLGYLIQGAALKENYWEIFYFRLLANIFLFATVHIKLITLKTHWQKLALLLGIVFVLTVGLSTDYIILYGFIILLTFDYPYKKRIKLYGSFIFGVVIGFSITAKFTLGVALLGLALLTYVGDVNNCLSKKKQILLNLSYCANILLFSSAVAFLVLIPNQLNRNIFFGFFCCCWFFFIFIKSCLIKHKPSLAKRNKLQTTLSIGFYLIIFSILFSLSKFTSFSSLEDFLITSLRISSDFSSAMSITGPYYETIYSSLLLFFIVVLFLYLTTKNTINPGFSIGIIFVTWLAFKHGYVRQDQHVLNFANTALIVSLIFIFYWYLQNKTAKKATLLVFLCSLAMLGYQSHFPSLGVLHPKQVISKILALTDLEEQRAKLIQSNEATLQKVKLNSVLNNYIGSNSIDIIPWELTLAPANNLNWNPKPAFQSYLAYSSQLDDLNLKSYLNSPREYLLHHFEAIDSRHPFFDEPATFYHIICHYQTIIEFPKLMSVNLMQVALLKRRTGSACLPTNFSRKHKIEWSEWIKVPENTFARAQIGFHYTILGKIYKFFFRIPSIYMNVRYSDGLSSSFRILPSNAGNGVVVSHLPRNKVGMFSIFKGYLPAKVLSFNFSTVNSLLFRPDIDVRFLLNRFVDGRISNKESIHIHIADLSDIRRSGSMGWRDASTPPGT